MRTKTFGGCKTCERPQQRDPFPTPFPLLSHSFPTPSPRSTVATVTATNNSPPHSLLHFDAGAEFEGGGTYFEHDDSTHQIGKGDCLVHSGKLRHSGVAITSGRRLLLVGFVEERYMKPAGDGDAAAWAAAGDAAGAVAMAGPDGDGPRREL